jgi:tryptophan-rich sensory protein
MAEPAAGAVSAKERSVNQERAPKNLRELGELLAAIAICESAGGIGAIATSDGTKTWYPTLKKPSFNPPGWIFAPVWTILYALMGVSAWLLWKRRGDARVAQAGTLFAVQLALNTLWSFIFFKWRSPGWAFLEIITLWAAIAMTIRALWRISPLAGALMLPYLAWTSFAMLLNGRIWQLNR